MNEVKLYGALLALLAVGAWVSWTREEPSASTANDKITIVDAAKDQLKGVTLYTKTQTVAVSFRKDDAGKDYPWFVVEQGARKRAFVGNEKVDKLVEGLAPLKALRNLGKLEKADLAETKLDPKPERRLVLGLKSGDKELDLGGRTTGSRDHYVRLKGASDIYLVASAVLGDLEFPEGRFMQRKLREEALKDVSKVVLRQNGKAKTILHKNRLAPTDSFWASEAKPDEKSETLGNYVDKLDKLSATDYGSDEEKLPRNGTPIIEVQWYGDDEAKLVASVEIWRVGEEKKAEYYALSSTTRVPVKLSKFSAEQVERDLTSVMAE